MSVELDSAGTGAWHVGQAPDKRMQAAALEAGYDLSGIRARQVEAADFGRFDRIIAMDRQNRVDLEALRPAGSATPVQLLLPFGPTGLMDVPDPYYEGRFDEVVRLIEHAVSGLLADIRFGQGS